MFASRLTTNHKPTFTVHTTQKPLRFIQPLSCGYFFPFLTLTAPLRHLLKSPYRQIWMTKEQRLLHFHRLQLDGIQVDFPSLYVKRSVWKGECCWMFVNPELQLDFIVRWPTSKHKVITSPANMLCFVAHAYWKACDMEISEGLHSWTGNGEVS